MAALMAAVAGGISLVAWKTATPTTRLVLATAVIALVYDDVLFEGNEFGLGDLVLSAAGAFAIVGVSN